MLQLGHERQEFTRFKEEKIWGKLNNTLILDIQPTYAILRQILSICGMSSIISENIMDRLKKKPKN